MDHKTLGLVLIVGGVLALLFSGGVGYGGMMGMMGLSRSYGLFAIGNGLGVTILAVMFIILGIHYSTKNSKHK